MAKQRPSRPKPAGPSAPRGGFRAKAGAMKAGMFAKMRANIDAVAFASPSGSPISARLFVESVEALQKRKQEPRNFVLLLSRGLDAEVFQVFQAPFTHVAPLLSQAPRSGGERAYWTLSFDKASRKLFTGDSAQVELRKIEKRRD